MPRFAADYLALDQGQVVREWILGDRFFAAGAGLESATLALGGLLLVCCVARHGRTAPLLRLAGISLACYAAIGAGLVLLPQDTRVHHWISGTPSRYLALGLAGAALLRPRRATSPPADGGRPRRRGARRRAGIAIGAVLLRVPPLLSVEHALLVGQSGPAFDPVFTQIGEFAGRRGGVRGGGLGPGQPGLLPGERPAAHRLRTVLENPGGARHARAAGCQQQIHRLSAHPAGRCAFSREYRGDNRR